MTAPITTAAVAHHLNFVLGIDDKTSGAIVADMQAENLLPGNDDALSTADAVNLLLNLAWSPLAHRADNALGFTDLVYTGALAAVIGDGCQYTSTPLPNSAPGESADLCEGLIEGLCAEGTLASALVAVIERKCRGMMGVVDVGTLTLDQRGNVREASLSIEPIMTPEEVARQNTFQTLNLQFAETTETRHEPMIAGQVIARREVLVPGTAISQLALVIAAGGVKESRELIESYRLETIEPKGAA